LTLNRQCANRAAGKQIPGFRSSDCLHGSYWLITCRVRPAPLLPRTAHTRPGTPALQVGPPGSPGGWRSRYGACGGVGAVLTSASTVPRREVHGRRRWPNTNRNRKRGDSPPILIECPQVMRTAYTS
jgi:hypothetical protein